MTRQTTEASTTRTTSATPGTASLHGAGGARLVGGQRLVRCGHRHQATSSRVRLVRHWITVKISVKKKITTPIAAP